MENTTVRCGASLPRHQVRRDADHSSALGLDLGRQVRPCILDGRGRDVHRLALCAKRDRT